MNWEEVLNRESYWSAKLKDEPLAKYSGMWTGEFHNWVREHVQEFRGDRWFLVQENPATQRDRYVLATGHLAARCPEILNSLVEDGAYGVLTAHVGDRVVSRDLLDATSELCCMKDAIASPRWRDAMVVDIGAGYGRLAHRAFQAKRFGVWPRQWVCTDTIPISMSICEAYLRERCVPEDFAMVLSPAEIALPSQQDSMLDLAPVVAVNVHSWSEVDHEGVQAWIKWISDRSFTHIFLVAHEVGNPTYDHKSTIVGEIMASDWSQVDRGMKLSGSNECPLRYPMGCMDAPYWVFERKSLFSRRSTEFGAKE